MLLRLSLDLGCPINELLQKLTSAEITEYMAFYSYTANPLRFSQAPVTAVVCVEDEISAMKEELG